MSSAEPGSSDGHTLPHLRSFDPLRRRLARTREPADDVDAAERRAVVAMLLRGEASTAEVLLMRRIEHPEDRWSGHISLPGGHVDPGDASLLAAAMRETAEEVGVDLERSARPLGRLPSVQAASQHLDVSLTITPFVFVGTRDVEPVAGPEAQEVFWFPLQRAAAGELDEEHRFRHRGEELRAPGWRFEGRMVWGLTHRMIRALLREMR